MRWAHTLREALNRPDVSSIFKRGRLGLVSVLLSFPQITSPLGFLQLIHHSGAITEAADSEPRSFTPSRANMSALSAQKQGLRALLTWPKVTKKHLALFHIWQSEGSWRCLAEIYNSGKKKKKISFPLSPFTECHPQLLNNYIHGPVSFCPRPPHWRSHMC